MNLMGICENKNCLAYKKQIVHMFGFGSFDLINDMKNKPPVCPSCEFPLRVLFGNINILMKELNMKMKN